MASEMELLNDKQVSFIIENDDIVDKAYKIKASSIKEMERKSVNGEVATIADMLALTDVKHNDVCKVLADGVGGDFKYDENKKDENDDICIINGWVRIKAFEDYVLNPEWGGAKNAYKYLNYDSYHGLQNTFNLLSFPSYKGFDVKIPAGLFLTSDTLYFQKKRWNDGGSLYGNGMHATNIKLTSPGKDSVLVISTELDDTPTSGLNSYTSYVKDLALYGMPDTKIIFDASLGSRIKISNMWIRCDGQQDSDKIGMWFGNWYTFVDGVDARNCGIGFYVTSGYMPAGNGYGNGTQAVSMKNCGAITCDVGMKIPIIPDNNNGLTDCNHFLVEGNSFEQCFSAGIYVEAPVINLNIFSNYFEANGNGGNGVPIIDKNGNEILVKGEVVINKPNNTYSYHKKISIIDNMVSNGSNSIYVVVANEVRYLTIKRNTYPTKSDNGILHCVGDWYYGNAVVESYDYSDTGIIPNEPIKIDYRAPNIKYTNLNKIGLKHNVFKHNDLYDENVLTTDITAYKEEYDVDGSKKFSFTLDNDGTPNLSINLPVDTKGYFRINGYFYNGVANEDKVASVYIDDVLTDEVSLSGSSSLINVRGGGSTSCRIQLGRNYNSTIYIKHYSLVPAGLEVDDKFYKTKEDGVIDSDTGRPIFWNKTKWVFSDGTDV